MEFDQDYINQAEQNEETVQAKDLIILCLSRWYWFVISVLACLAVAFFYILKTPAVYSRTEEVQIKTDSRGRSSSDLSQFQDLGLFSTNTNVYNEIKAFSSNIDMLEVVKNLHLDMNYVTDGRFHANTLYGKSLPVNIELLEIDADDHVTFDTDLHEDGSVKLSSFTLNGNELDGTVSGAFADTLDTPVGKALVNPTTNYVAKNYPVIHVTRTSYVSAGRHYSGELSVSLSDKLSQVILLSINDISIQRAEDILSTLVSVYNEKWVADKNQVAVSTSAFINERLAVIERELAGVDSDISNFKSKNLLPDVEAASSLYMTRSNEIDSRITDLNNQLYMTKYVKDYLATSNNSQLLPANSGIASDNIESQIKEYNTAVLQRNTLEESSSSTNPLVLDLDKSISSLREAIITSVDNQILALNNEISSLQKTEKQATAKIAANPTQAQYLLSVERQQAVKEALYLFLLQKREENELSQAFTAYNTRIVDPPHGSSAPTAPRRSMIMLLALLAGLAIPFCIIYVLEVLNGKVRGRNDLKALTIPFAGEIPFFGEKSGALSFIRRKKKAGEQKKHEIVVESGNRNIVNEAFRVLRTNIEFMNKKDDTCVVVLTSFNPGSGKSFVTANLAMALAIKGKKVLGVDCDLRHGSLSDYADKASSRAGFSDYLSGQTDDIDGLLRKSPKNENLDFLPVGTIPPNPSELVADDRFVAALEHFKGKYDYILLDCPPIDVVADAQIIAQYADRTLFILRSGLCERSMLPELEGYYRNGRFNNLAVVLNATELAKGGYFGYKYGYKYGYHYGYGYGYDSYYGSKDGSSKS